MENSDLNSSPPNENDCLDSLLDDALEDFNKPIPPKRNETILGSLPPSEDAANTSVWTEEFIKQATQNFEVTMKSILEHQNISTDEKEVDPQTVDLQNMSAEFTKFAEIAAKAASESSSDQDFTNCLTETMKQIAKNNEEAQKLKETCISRMRLFKFNQKLSSLILSSSFKVHFAKRKLEGEIMVNYSTETVEILMRKSVGKEKSVDGLQSLKMMSGGERSFATVSYIVALWELVHSPVRIMDEFDIFMDVVSKKQCLDMIVQTVSKQAQYILVSPQEYSGNTSDNLTVFRMPDPERSGLRRQAVDEEED